MTKLLNLIVKLKFVGV